MGVLTTEDIMRIAAVSLTITAIVLLTAFLISKPKPWGESYSYDGAGNLYTLDK